MDFKKHADVLVGLTASQNADIDNRDACREAHLFLDKRDGQWEPYWWTAMEKRPRYTFDQTGPIVDQIAGEMDQADFSVTVKPAGGETTEDDAELFDGMIRNIENVSSAADIYGLAARGMITGGIDGWQIKHKYVDDDSFDMDLVIEPIANFVDSVWFDHFTKPDASDAKWVVVLEAILKDDYDERWPEGSGASVDESRLSEAYYNKHEQVVIGQIYYIKQVDRELLLMSNGSVLERSDETESIIDELELAGITIEKERTRKKDVVMSRLFDGNDWLNEEQKTVFNQIPVIPCIANFKIFENKLIYRGVVEKLFDAQRVYNYSKSREVEEVALSPRSKYWMTPAQGAGHSDTLSTLNTNADPVQFYNNDPDVPGAPQQNGGSPINPGLKTVSDDMQMIMGQTAGLFAPNMGDNPNLQSGVAIKSLQRKGDTSTIKYFKSQERAIARTGRILVDAIPVVYDTTRQIRIMKEDGQFEMTVLNQVMFDQSTMPPTPVMIHDVSKGKYDVTCSAGPAFQNRQEETVDAIVQMGAVDPSIIETGSDILFKNIDSPGMDLLAERKREQLFEAGMIPEKQMTDEEQQIYQQKQQEPQQPDPAMVLAQAEQGKAEAEKGKAKAAADKIQIEAWAVQQEQARKDAKEQRDTQQQMFDQMMDRFSKYVVNLEKLVNSIGPGTLTLQSGELVDQAQRGQQ